VPAAEAAARTAATTTAALAAAATTTPAATAAQIGVAADIAHGGLHRIGLARAALVAALGGLVAGLLAAAGAEALRDAALAARRMAAVEGLLQRIDVVRDEAVVVLVVVTALHACNTATDDAIRFALQKHAKYIVVVPCCQAEVAGVLRQNKSKSLGNALTEIWRHPLHTREFGSQITNVLRCLQLEAHGYQVSVTELVGWEHSMKNELIIAQYKDLPRRRPAERLNEVMDTLGIAELRERFFVEA